MILPGLLKQECVYWPPGELDEYGRRSAGNPVTLDCAYELTQRMVTLPNGRKFEISATVFLKESVQEEGWLWVSSLGPQPSVPDDQLRIKAVSYHSDVDDIEKLWKAMV